MIPLRSFPTLPSLGRIFNENGAYMIEATRYFMYFYVSELTCN